MACLGAFWSAKDWLTFTLPQSVQSVPTDAWKATLGTGISGCLFTLCGPDIPPFSDFM